MKTPFLTITEGTEYLYLADRPAGCKGRRYRVVKLVLAVPSYQQQVCVECLEGPDAGLWFVCSPHNFSTRHRPVPADPLPLEKQAGHISLGNSV